MDFFFTGGIAILLDGLIDDFLTELATVGGVHVHDLGLESRLCMTETETLIANLIDGCDLALIGTSLNFSSTAPCIGKRCIVHFYLTIYINRGNKNLRKIIIVSDYIFIKFFF